MTFTGAISHVFRHTFDFKSVASRSEYWYFALFSFLLQIVLGVFDGILSKALSSNITLLENLASILLVLPQLSVTVRRFHDAGFSGKWLLVGLLPAISFVFCIPTLTEFGNLPSNYSDAQVAQWMMSLPIAAVIPIFVFVLTVLAAGLFTFVVTLKGSKSHAAGNRYAPVDPKEPPVSELRDQGW